LNGANYWKNRDTSLTDPNLSPDGEPISKTNGFLTLAIIEKNTKDLEEKRNYLNRIYWIVRWQEG
jgi:hypothetical protein